MVESQTVVGTKQHGRGTVDAQIIKADIPVQVKLFEEKKKKLKTIFLQNGIVHLISKPLVIMASTIWEHLDPAKPVNIIIIVIIIIISIIVITIIILFAIIIIIIIIIVIAEQPAVQEVCRVCSSQSCSC